MRGPVPAPRPSGRLAPSKIVPDDFVTTAPLEYLARDDGFLDLVGAFLEALRAGIAVNPLDRMRLPVADPAVDLQRLIGDALQHRDGEELRHGGEHVGPRARALPLRGRVQDQPPRGLELRRHVGDHEGDRLSPPQRLAEGLPGARPLDGELEGAAREPHATHGDGDAARRQKAPEGDVEPLTLLAQAIGDGQRCAVEPHARMIAAAHAHGLRHDIDLSVGGIPRHEQRHGPVRSGRAGQAGEEQPAIADRAEGDHVLLARDQVAIAFPGHRAAQVRAGAGAGLGEREGHLQLPGHAGPHEPAALLLRRMAVESAPDSVDHVHDHAHRGVRHAEELHELEITAERQPPAAK